MLAGFCQDNSRKLGIIPEPISSLPCYNPYSLNLQRCETGSSIGLLTDDFGLLTQKKYPNVCQKIRNYKKGGVGYLISGWGIPSLTGVYPIPAFITPWVPPILTWLGVPIAGGGTPSLAGGTPPDGDGLPPSCGQIDTYENSTFPSYYVHWRQIMQTLLL